jgi:hypothetical protein
MDGTRESSRVVEGENRRVTLIVTSISAAAAFACSLVSATTIATCWP